MHRQLIEHVLGLKMPASTALDLISRMYVIEQEDKPKVLAIDMDDTLLKYVRGGGYGAPLPGMVNLLKQLRAAGWKIAIWTCRPNVERVKEKLKEKGIPFDYVNDNPHGKDNDKLRKIHADVYLDDKAITAGGSADGLLDKITNFQSWSKKAREEKKRKESVDEATPVIRTDKELRDASPAKIKSWYQELYKWVRSLPSSEQYQYGVDIKRYLAAAKVAGEAPRESIDEAHVCHCFNPNTGVCEGGCSASGVAMGQQCPWAPDWDKAAQNPDLGGCACYG